LSRCTPQLSDGKGPKSIATQPSIATLRRGRKRENPCHKVSIYIRNQRKKLRTESEPISLHDKEVIWRMKIF
jgi:hypothetical protein